MGVCCETVSMSTVLSDLDIRESTTGDLIETWELQLPFSRCSFYTFEYLLQKAHEESGNLGYVTFHAISQNFTTKAWVPLHERKSELSLFLMQHLQHENKEAFDFESLMIFGLLHCVDRSNPVNKAKAFFSVLQDGGSAKQSHINARDRDWIPVANKLFRLACIVPAEGSRQSAKYSAGELRAISEVMPEVDPDNAFSKVLGWNDEEVSLLEDLFGTNSTIRFEVFVESCSKHANWIFNAPEVRRRIFEAAEITMKHFED